MTTREDLMVVLQASVARAKAARGVPVFPTAPTALRCGCGEDRRCADCDRCGFHVHCGDCDRCDCDGDRTEWGCL